MRPATKAEGTGKMKILVAIANYGDTSGKFIHQLIDSYRSFSCEVDIVALSNVEKEVAEGVEIRVGLPTANPWSLPFSHRDLFVERQDDYDLFIYSEDDTLITEDHISAFLQAQEALPEGYIAGFVRHEIDQDKNLHYSTVHASYHWEPDSVLEAGGELYAHFTNEHSAAYVLTRAQLKACIASGGFLIPPHEGRYDMLCSAATDPYTRCGFRKVVCISRLLEFSLHHLPNKYVGKIGLPKSEIDLHLQKLEQIHHQSLPSASLLDGHARVEFTHRFDRSFFTPEVKSVLRAAPASPARVLSVGCDMGRTEASLASAGHSVKAIPLDPVIAESARLRGVEILDTDLSNPASSIKDASYDVVLMNLCLPYVRDPVDFLKRFRPALTESGNVIVLFWNWSCLAERKRLKAERNQFPEAANVGDFAKSNIHRTDPAIVRSWLKQAGFQVERTAYDTAGKAAKLSKLTLGMVDPWLGLTGAMLARVR
ncbi:class I SAM-dependent methyltransferase [Vannielia litorea]|uniref:class I SAM-dependent methyltransferase n=1 Tax=Vannielia litorea TaxID=1217970 RepID=UPI001C96EB8C|nr:methyltransferase domain-containing protein [Vannielia litorea]MBY6155182.1 class I SAM-dependent methyltransferase [Vannielia litorea]